MVQNLQGLSSKVCPTNIANIFGTQIIYSSFWDVRHYTPEAYCHVTRTHEVCLYCVFCCFKQTFSLHIHFTVAKLTNKSVENCTFLPSFFRTQ